MSVDGHVAGSRIEIARQRHGDPAGRPVVLLHGFPYDPRCFDDVATGLAADGADVIVPYPRGFGPSRFRSPAALRSGQQAALAHDLRELIDTLALDRPIVAGFDWGAFEATAVSFDNPDFVDTAHSYRHRYGLVAGDPAYEESETVIARTPRIGVPAIVIDPTEYPVPEPQSESSHAARFTGLVDHRRVGTGHNTPHEDPAALVDAVRTLHRHSVGRVSAGPATPTSR